MTESMGHPNGGFYLTPCIKGSSQLRNVKTYGFI